MVAEKQPASPVYMSYIYEHPEPISQPAAVDVYMHSTTGSPYRPSTHLTQAELDLQSTKGVYEHFHAPWNQHNRFLSSVRYGTDAQYNMARECASACSHASVPMCMHALFSCNMLVWV